MKNYSIQQTIKLFGLDNFHHKNDLLLWEKNHSIPQREQLSSGHKVWQTSQLPSIGAHVGFLGALQKKKVITTFVTKGGVLKTSLSYNLARTLALHNHKVCVIGLDIQGDMSNILSQTPPPQNNSNFEKEIERMNQLQGLFDFKEKKASLSDIVDWTDLPSLSFIPETPELVKLDQSLLYQNRREYWLKNQVVSPLLESFDFVIIDCPPNWNNLIVNALITTDLLLSPLECKINNFRNFQMFHSLINDFKKDFQLEFDHLYIPTKYSKQKKLNRDILSWYQQHVPHLTSTSISESLQGEEASALKLSLPEYAPNHNKSFEIKHVLKEAVQPLLSQEQSSFPSNFDNKELSS